MYGKDKVKRDLFKRKEDVVCKQTKNRLNRFSLRHKSMWEALLLGYDEKEQTQN